MKIKIFAAACFFIAAALLTWATFAGYVMWRTRQIAVTVDGRPLKGQRVFGVHGRFYAEVPNPEYEAHHINEAYIVDYAYPVVMHNDPGFMLSTPFALLSIQTPPIGGPGFGKLEREKPLFSGDSVTFRSDENKLIQIRWLNRPR